MQTKEDLLKIKGEIQAAFAPLRCVAEVYDYQTKLRFKVFDPNDNGVLERTGIALRDLRDRSGLHHLIQDARAWVQDKGFILS